MRKEDVLRVGNTVSFLYGDKARYILIIDIDRERGYAGPVVSVIGMDADDDECITYPKRYTVSLMSHICIEN